MSYIEGFKEQTWLLPPSVEDLIPKDHVCFLVEALIDRVDYSSFDVKYSGPGHPAYHPGIMLKLLVMGVLDQVRSSRRLAKNARENVVYMYLSEKLSPDFRTISDFRKNNPEIVKDLFKHVVRIAHEEGLIDLSHLSTDGSTIKASASNKKTLTREELEFLTKFVDEELEEWAKKDKIEDELFHESRGYDKLSEENQKRIKRLVGKYVEKYKDEGCVFKKFVKEKLAKAEKEVKEEKLEKVSLTDPEARFMKNKKGRVEYSYNVQITVDRGGFILANDVCQVASDTNQLKSQVALTQKNLGEELINKPWTFDAGYFQGENLKFLEEEGIDAYIPSNDKSEIKDFDKENFHYDPVKDQYVCPEKQALTFFMEALHKRNIKNPGKIVRFYKGQSCILCGKKHECTKSKTGIRVIKRFPYEEERNRMIEKMKTETGKETYKLRAQTVEPVIGDIKQNKRVTAFLTRHLKTVKTEFNIACTANNIKRIMNRRKEQNTTHYKTIENSIIIIGQPVKGGEVH